jgi:hypothetical protein
VRRSAQRTRRVLSVLAVGVLWCAVPAGALPGTTATSSLPVPAAWGSMPQVAYTSVACAEVESCTTIGTFAGAHGVQNPASDVELDGSWSTPTTFSLPSGGEPVSFGLGFRSVSCPTQGSCVAVGTYADPVKGKGFEPMVATQTHGVWGAATDPLTLPAGDTSGELTGVWCQVAGSCVVVGLSFGNGEVFTGFMDNEVSGTWQPPSTLPVPSSTKVGRPVRAFPTALACTDANDCVVVGSFKGPSVGSSELGMVEVERNGAWTVKAYVGPTMPGFGSELYVDTVACTSLDLCVGGGTLLDKANALVPFAIVGHAGQWGPVSVLPWRYAWPESGGGAVNDVACAGATRCMAVGELQGLNFGNTSGNGGAFPVAYTYAAGHWSPPSLIEPPARPLSGGATLSAVACPSPTGCVAVGSTTPQVGSPNDLSPYAAVVAPIKAVSRPTAPIRLHVGRGRGLLQVSWSMRTAEGGAPIQRFTVVATSPGAPTLTCVSTALSCRLRGVALHHRYTISVSATNAAGRRGAAAHGSYLG